MKRRPPIRVANAERIVASIEQRLRGVVLTNAQAARIRRATDISAATATDLPADSTHG